jgi:DNA-binding phage protein
MKLTKDNYLDLMLEAKEACDLEGTEIAKRMGVSAQHVYRLLAGEWEPRIKTFTKFMDACKCDVEVE